MVRLTVEFGVHSTVLDAKICTKVNHPQPSIQERAGKLMSHPMGKRKEDKFGAAAHEIADGGRNEGEIRVTHSREPGKDLLHALPRELTGGESH
jgi:hypothetical protein